MGCQGRSKATVGDLCHPADELRVWYGSADIHPGATDRRGLRHAVFFLPGPRLHEAGWLREDPRGDHRALSRIPFAPNHPGEARTLISLVSVERGLDADLSVSVPCCGLRSGLPPADPPSDCAS